MTYIHLDDLFEFQRFTLGQLNVRNDLPLTGEFKTDRYSDHHSAGNSVPTCIQRNNNNNNNA